MCKLVSVNQVAYIRGNKNAHHHQNIRYVIRYIMTVSKTEYHGWNACGEDIHAARKSRLRIENTMTVAIVIVGQEVAPQSHLKKIP